METLLILLFVLVALAGMAAFGPWTRSRKPGEFPWE